ncbi:MAG: GH3 auxin-responsive promoter family protein [Treponema sp.]|nr:GH3 auxin-responsive promoter family protein [Treponema sp.]
MTMKRVKGAGLITIAVAWVGRKNYRILKKAAKNCARSTEKTLRGILEYAKDSEWGKAHNFAQILAAKTDKELYELWQKNVPPQDYEDLRPFVERHKHGEENVLFPGKPIMYATTSGTTSSPKWIPITEIYYSNIFSTMSKLWLYSFMRQRPKVFWGICFSTVGKAVEGYAPDGTPCGSVSGLTQRDCPGFIKKLYSAPPDIFDIEDYAARNYALMRTGIEQNVTSFITANPSTAIELQRTVDEYIDEMISDIRNGTLSDKFSIAPNIRRSLAARYRSNPARADELAALKQKYGRILPKHYWPDFQFITTWKCGNTRVYTEKIRDWYPEHTCHQEFGYFASECRSGLVMNGGNDTVLFPYMHYFEFTDADDIDNPNPKFLQIHELKKGRRYLIYITTYAGLYRYNMNDMIEVTGFYGTIPTIQFIQKVNGIISMTGEKIHERQFMEAVRQAEKETGIKTRFYVGFADVNESRYHYYIEFADTNLSQESADDFAGNVDEKLKKINVEYEAKRDSFRVKAPVVHILKENAFEDFKVESIRRGLAREGQFKMNLLMQDEKRHAMFKALVK